MTRSDPNDPDDENEHFKQPHIAIELFPHKIVYQKLIRRYTMLQICKSSPTVSTLVRKLCHYNDYFLRYLGFSDLFGKVFLII